MAKFCSSIVFLDRFLSVPRLVGNEMNYSSILLQRVLEALCCNPSITATKGREYLFSFPNWCIHKSAITIEQFLNLNKDLLNFNSQNSHGQHTSTVYPKDKSKNLVLQQFLYKGRKINGCNKIAVKLKGRTYFFLNKIQAYCLALNWIFYFIDYSML